MQAFITLTLSLICYNIVISPCFLCYGRCNKCGRESPLPSRFYELELNIQGHKNLTECVTEFLKVIPHISLPDSSICQCRSDIEGLNVLFLMLFRRRSWTVIIATIARAVRVNRTPPVGSSSRVFPAHSIFSSCVLFLIGECRNFCQLSDLLLSVL